jgi:hypothetical protein
MNASGEGNETAGEVPSAQAPATEVPATQGTESQGAPVSQPWKAKIGDTEYDEQTWKTRGVEDFKRFQGEYTRTRQQLSEYEGKKTAGEELLELVRNDPGLWTEVRRRIANGESRQQAVQNAAQNDPRLEEVSSLKTDVETMKQERAVETFRSDHPDLNQEDEEYITQWVTDRTDKLRNAGWSYNEILDTAYAHLFKEKKASALQAQALQQGQQIKEKEIQNGRKAKSLGTVSPTANAAPPKKGPTSKMRPADRTETAMGYWQKNARKG